MKRKPDWWFAKKTMVKEKLRQKMQIITKSIYITVKCFVKQKINSAVETTIQRNTEEKL